MTRHVPVEAECLDVWMYIYILYIYNYYIHIIHSFHALNQDFTVVQSASELQIDALDSLVCEDLAGGIARMALATGFPMVFQV